MCARRSWRDPAGASPVRVGRSGRSVASVARARRRRRPRSVHSDPVGCVWSPEMVDVAEAEALSIVEGNMCGIVMRDAVAPPGSETTSCRKGSRRNLGGLRAARSRVERSRAAPGSPDGRTPAMYGREESDGCVVPGKPSNKAGRDRRRRRWREGARSRRGRGVPHMPDAVPGFVCRCAPRPRADVVGASSSKTGAGCGKAASPDLRGGCGATRIPTATIEIRGDTGEIRGHNTCAPGEAGAIQPVQVRSE